MKGIIGNTRDAAYLDKLGYKLWRNDRQGCIVFDKHDDMGTRRIMLNYPERTFCIVKYDLDLRPVGKAKQHGIANLRETVMD